MSVYELLGRLAIRDVGTRRISTGASLPVLGLLLSGCVFLLVGSLASSQFAQLTVGGVARGSVFASLALALVLIYRATEVVNFAQGEMALLTTYFAYQLTLWGLSYWLAFFLTLGIAFVYGVVVQVAAIRPVQHKSVLAVVIVTIGLFILIDGLVTWKWGADLKFMPAPFGNAVYHVGSVAIARQDIGTLLVTIFSVILLWVLFQFTKLGLAMRAAALRPAAASLVGVRVNWMLAIGWGLAAVLGAVAGLMAEPAQYVLQPTLMQPILLYAFAAAVLGGLESPAGAVVGGLALGVFLNLIGQYVGFASAELRLPIAFAVLLAVLLVKPTGLFGRRQVRRV
jgi:branched-chain amino acid transport system permease protein